MIRTDYETTVKFTVADMIARQFIDKEQTFIGRFDTDEKITKLQSDYEKENKVNCSPFEVLRIVASVREMDDETWMKNSTVKEAKTIYVKPELKK